MRVPSSATLSLSLIDEEYHDKVERSLEQEHKPAFARNHTPYDIQAAIRYITLIDILKLELFLINDILIQFYF